MLAEKVNSEEEWRKSDDDVSDSGRVTSELVGAVQRSCYIAPVGVGRELGISI